MPNHRKTVQLFLILLIVCLLIISIVLGYIQLIGNPYSIKNLSAEETPREALGTFGDYIGGVLNPLLAFLSFIALLYTLKLNQEELHETRKELKRAADAQEQSQKLRNEQLTTQFLQQFDSFFSMLLNQLHHKIEAIRQDQVLDQLHQNMERELSPDEIWYVQELKNLFNFIYLSLDAVSSHIGRHSTFDDMEKLRLKTKYWSIVRSMIPEKVMHLMIKDCVDDQQDPKMRRHQSLIEEADFFENISFYGLSANQKFWLIWASSKFDSQIFGENDGFAQLQKTLVFQLISRTNIQDVERFLLYIFEQAALPTEMLDRDQKIINLNLKSTEKLLFDFRKNKTNPDIYYDELSLSSIEIENDRMTLFFRHDNHRVTKQLSLIFIQNDADIQLKALHFGGKRS